MDDSLHETFWAWALNRYEARALRDCLLALQDSSGLVVVQALLYAWLAERGRQLTSDEVRTLERTMAPWVAHILQPLRRQRVVWRDGEKFTRLYTEALQLELEAEKALAKLLCDCLTPPHSGSVPIPVGSNLCLITALSAPDGLDSLIAAFGQ